MALCFIQEVSGCRENGV